MSTSPGRLPERDVHYLKLLKTLKASQDAGGGGQTGVVTRIADWIDSVPVLNFICANPGWCDDWGVKEALLHNDLTPARWRVELEKQVAIFDLLREMDSPELSPDEKGEIQEDLKYLFKTLSEHDRAVVKQRAKSLARSAKDAPKRPAAEGAPAATAEVPAEPSISQELLAGDLGVASPEPVVAHSDGAVTEQLHAAEEDAFAAEWAAAMAEMEAAEDDGVELVVDEELLVEEEPEAPTAVEPEAPEPEPAPEELEGAIDESAAAAAPIAQQPVAARIEAAATSHDAAVLGALAHDPSEDVQLALVRNPSLADGPAAILARRAGSQVAAAIHRERRLFMRPMVQKALLECPNAPSTALLEIVNSISDVPGLMGLIKSPKVKFLEVKAKARHRLTTIFRALGPNEKMAVLRRAGRGIIKELWTDFFRDEALVLRCIREKQVDSGTVLEIARSSIAPRKALEAIANTAQYVANYQVTLQLVLNPKTPRQAVTKLIRKLNPADRRMVKSNPSLPESVRRMA